jgi:ArsR family transcriptional regulator
MDAYLDITRALSDESRVRALVSLADGELCVCQIIELLGLSPSTVSKHMSILQRAGLVQRRKDGRWHYYRLADEDAPPVVRQALRWTIDTLRTEKMIVADAQAICCVRAKDRKELTACYNVS